MVPVVTGVAGEVAGEVIGVVLAAWIKTVDHQSLRHIILYYIFDITIMG